MADDIEQRFTIQIALQLGFDQVPGALVDPGHPPADMRSDQDALHAPKPVTVRQRLGIGHVQRGPDPTRTDGVREGVGLSNIRLRLEQLYGARGSIALKGNPQSGTEVAVRIPRDRARELRRGPLSTGCL